MSVHITYVLEESEILALTDKAKSSGMTFTEIVKTAIREYCNRENSSSQENPDERCSGVLDKEILFYLMEQDRWHSTYEIKKHFEELGKSTRCVSSSLNRLEKRCSIECNIPHEDNKRRTNNIATYWRSIEPKPPEEMPKEDAESESEDVKKNPATTGIIVDYLTKKGWTTTKTIREDLGKEYNVTSISSSLNYLMKKGIISCDPVKRPGVKRHTTIDKVKWMVNEGASA